MAATVPSILILALALSGSGRGAAGQDEEGAAKARATIFGQSAARIGRPGTPAPPPPEEATQDQGAKARARELRGKKAWARPADAEQIRTWFGTCDHNENGWLSFRETAISLGFNRSRFQAFDEDRDGRLDEREFDELYLHTIVTAGRFKAPSPPPKLGPPPTRSPEQMRNAYDTNLDRGLDALEVANLLADYRQRRADPDRVLATLDASGDGVLELDELEGLHGILHPVQLAPTVPDEAPVTTVADLFGEVVPRGTEPGSTPSPPRIVGPVGHFRRLDLDDDGFISAKDLETLLRPVRVSIRPHTVINTLDADGDMRLSEAEFVRCLIDVGK